MTTILIYDWAFVCTEQLRECGLSHMSKLEVIDVWWYVEKFISLGLSVMIEYNSNDCIYTLNVDVKSRRFKQR